MKDTMYNRESNRRGIPYKNEQKKEALEKEEDDEIRPVIQRRQKVESEQCNWTNGEGNTKQVYSRGKRVHRKVDELVA